MFYGPWWTCNCIHDFSPDQVAAGDRGLGPCIDLRVLHSDGLPVNLGEVSAAV